MNNSTSGFFHDISTTRNILTAIHIFNFIKRLNFFQSDNLNRVSVVFENTEVRVTFQLFR